jgi:hypothetical protein
MSRIAQCSCGSLRAEANGEPVLVHVCNCTECQRRTGSPFLASSFFPKSEVHTHGPSKGAIVHSKASHSRTAVL